MKIKFNMKKIVRNGFIVDAKNKKEAIKIYKVIRATTDILDRLVDDEATDDIAVETTYEVLPKEYDN